MENNQSTIERELRSSVLVKSAGGVVKKFVLDSPARKTTEAGKQTPARKTTPARKQTPARKTKPVRKQTPACKEAQKKPKSPKSPSQLAKMRKCKIILQNLTKEQIATKMAEVEMEGKLKKAVERVAHNVLGLDLAHHNSIQNASFARNLFQEPTNTFIQVFGDTATKMAVIETAGKSMEVASIERRVQNERGWDLAHRNLIQNSSFARNWFQKPTNNSLGRANSDETNWIQRNDTIRLNIFDQNGEAATFLLAGDMMNSILEAMGMLAISHSANRNRGNRNNAIDSLVASYARNWFQEPTNNSLVRANSDETNWIQRNDTIRLNIFDQNGEAATFLLAGDMMNSILEAMGMMAISNSANRNNAIDSLVASFACNWLQEPSNNSLVRANPDESDGIHHNYSIRTEILAESGGTATIPEALAMMTNSNIADDNSDMDSSDQESLEDDSADDDLVQRLYQLYHGNDN